MVASTRDSKVSFFINRDLYTWLQGVEEPDLVSSLQGHKTGVNVRSQTHTSRDQTSSVGDTFVSTREQTHSRRPRYHVLSYSGDDGRPDTPYDGLTHSLPRTGDCVEVPCLTDHSGSAPGDSSTRTHSGKKHVTVTDEVPPGTPCHFLSCVRNGHTHIRTHVYSCVSTSMT